MIDNPYAETGLNNLRDLIDSVNERREHGQKPTPESVDIPTGPQPITVTEITDDGIYETTSVEWVANPVLRLGYLNRGGSDA
ncbi:hypothetical protein D7316_02248 [Gordonia insulae]|uniref:Uncharacterized protein n=1 Tax=Gordonia insulae TaxID=2420509 RepID=A0A3G8JL94_9ACTN|nr:hypothetical protein D7316_02248 [Gordonia insulae]